MVDNYSTKNQLNLPICLQFNSPSSIVCGNSRFHGSRRHLVSRARMLGETGASRAKLHKIYAKVILFDCSPFLTNFDGRREISVRGLTSNDFKLSSGLFRA